MFRRDERTQKLVTHGFFPPNVTEEDVSKAFGGGTYRAQLVIPDPTSGLTKIKRSRDFVIPGQYRAPSTIHNMEDVGPNGTLAAASLAVAAAPTTPGLPSTGELMQALNAGVISSVIDLLKSMREVKTIAPTAPDPMLLRVIESQGQIQMKILEMLMTRPDGNSENKDVLGMLVKMKEIVAPAGAVAPGVNPMEMFNTMLDTFTRMREVADQVATPQTDSDPFMSSIPKLVEVVAEQHQMNKNDRERRATAHMTPQSSAQAPIVGTIQPQTQMPEIPLWQKTLRQQSARLLASAVAKHDADVIAGTAILFAPPHVLEALKLFFHRTEEEVVADVLVEIPQMADHREWLMEFVNAAQFRLFPDEFGEDGDEGEGGETGAGDSAPA